MPFETVKEKEATTVYLKNSEKRSYFIFILFLILQVIVLGLLSLYNEVFDVFFTFASVLSLALIIIFFVLIFVQKSLRLSQEEISIEYKLFGLYIYKIRMQWAKIHKIAVEFTRLKGHDILLQLDNKTIYLGTSLDEEKSDALLKEIQLFHHYYIT